MTYSTGIIAAVATTVLVANSAMAQRVKYPASHAIEFEKADSTISPEAFTSPVICVSDARQAAEVASLGGIPVMLPYVGANYQMERQTAANIDGYVISGNEDPMRIKALAEQNVPILGTCPMLDSLNVSLWHNTRTIPDIASLVGKARTFRHARQLMESTVTLDSHCDLPMRFRTGYDIAVRSPLSQVSIQKMREGRLSAMFLAVYLPKGPINDSAFVALKSRCLETIGQIHAQADRNKQYCSIACTADEARDARRQGKIAFFIGVENGSPIGNDLGMIRRLRGMGVTYITLCHNGDNQICHTSRNAMGSMEGLTPFGVKVVGEMNRCGVVIDLSHASDGTVRDVCRLSRTPVVCTHSTCRTLYSHNRNVTDDQIRSIAATGGVIQITLLKSFMAPRKSPDRIGVDDMIRHIDHVVSVAGIDHVGIGMDMCGGGGEWDYYSSSDAVWLTMRLIEHGYSDSDIRKIWGDNFLRVLEQNRQHALRSGFREK